MKWKLRVPFVEAKLLSLRLLLLSSSSVISEELQTQQEIKLKKEEEKMKKEKIKSFSSINQKLEEFHDIVGTPKTKRTYL